MAKTKRVLVVLVVLLLAIAVIVLSRRGSGGGTTASTRSSGTMTSSGTTTASSRGSPASTDARAPGAVSEHRATMLAAIERAREARERTGAPARTSATPGAPGTGTGSSSTTLDLVDKTGDTSDWQKRAHGTLNSLLGQCYDLARAEDATLEGTLTVRFTIVGEPSVGGLLEKVEIVDGDTTITQQTLRECVTQQLYALELDPPPDGVSIERELSLKFP